MTAPDPSGPPRQPAGPPVRPAPLSTAWARSRQTPLRQFLRTETGSAAILLAATVAALIWANADQASYEACWATRLSIRLGSAGLSDDLQGWLNSGLMAFFFLVAGLEARREFDMGELRERRRLALPLLIGLGGMIVPIGIYLAINAGHPTVTGWGTAMSTDTAFALGMLALVGPNVPDRVRTYLLTFAIVDDVAGIAVIAVVYSGHIDLVALAVGVAFLAVVALARALGIRRGVLYVALGVAAWVAFFQSGVDPLVVGLAMGLLTVAYPAGRRDLERASESVPAVPRAAHAGTGALRARRRARRDLAERPDAADLPSLVELPDRAAVRAGQRRRHDQRELPGPRLHHAGHAGHPARLRDRQAGRDRGHGLAAYPAQPAGASGRRSAGPR